VCVSEREKEREREPFKNLSNEAAWARVGLSRHGEGKKKSFLMPSDLVTPVKCVEC